MPCLVDGISWEETEEGWEVGRGGGDQREKGRILKVKNLTEGEANHILSNAGIWVTHTTEKYVIKHGC